jgi:hypothetical protein
VFYYKLIKLYTFDVINKLKLYSGLRGYNLDWNEGNAGFMYTRVLWLSQIINAEAFLATKIPHQYCIVFSFSFSSYKDMYSPLLVEFLLFAGA